MYAQGEKQEKTAKKTGKKSVNVNTVTQYKNHAKQGFRFMDNRQEAVAQRKLRVLAREKQQPFFNKADQDAPVQLNRVSTPIDGGLVTMDDGSKDSEKGTVKSSSKDSKKAKMEDSSNADAMAFLTPNNPANHSTRQQYNQMKGKNTGLPANPKYPLQKTIQLKKTIGYVGPYPLIQFGEKETIPETNGKLKEDADHIYEQKGEGKWLRKPCDESAAKLQQEVKEAVKELGSVVNSTEEILVDNSTWCRYMKNICVQIKSKFNELVPAYKDKKKDATALKELLGSIGHLFNSFQFQISQVRISKERDSELGDMYEAGFSKQLHGCEMQIQSQETGLGVVHLFGGGLPSPVIDIIGRFYENDFKVENHYEGGDIETILNDLVSEKEKSIRQGENQKNKKIRRFNGKKDAAERLILREELRDQAKKAAERRTVTPKKGGSLRSWHLNDTGNLPRTVLKGQHNQYQKIGNSKAGDIKKGFNSEAKKTIDEKALITTAQKALHKLWSKEVQEGIGFQPGYIDDFPGGAKSFRNEAKQIEPGYIEVNPEGWVQAESQGRLIYDYLEDRWFLTTDHYKDHFWEIIVPKDFKELMKSDKSSQKGSEEDSTKTISVKESSESIVDPTNLQLHNTNNCLIDAIIEAAIKMNLRIEQQNVVQIREDLQTRHLGNIGEMLYADQAVVETILSGLGLMGQVFVVLYDAGGQGQDIGGGGNVMLEIFHTGALHYVGHPANDAQKKLLKK